MGGTSIKDLQKSKQYVKKSLFFLKLFSILSLQLLLSAGSVFAAAVVLVVVPVTATLIITGVRLIPRLMGVL